jgi:putative alpha-1,2-mannosidase
VEANQENKLNLFWNGTKNCLSRSVKRRKNSNKSGSSPTGHEGAKLNSSEIEGWNFEKSKASRRLWDKQLSKIDITESNQDKSYFYTAFYHTMVQPNIAQILMKVQRKRQ